jgi:hypothetical protein
MDRHKHCCRKVGGVHACFDVHLPLPAGLPLPAAADVVLQHLQRTPQRNTTR